MWCYIIGWIVLPSQLGLVFCLDLVPGNRYVAIFVELLVFHGRIGAQEFGPLRFCMLDFGHSAFGCLVFFERLSFMTPSFFDALVI